MTKKYILPVVLYGQHLKFSGLLPNRRIRKSTGFSDSFRKILNGIAILVFSVLTLTCFGQNADPPITNKDLDIPNKNAASLYSRSNVTAADIDRLILAKNPKAQIMEIFIDTNKNNKIVFWGRLFEDAPFRKSGKEARSTKRKIDFELDANTGKFIKFHETTESFRCPADAIPTQGLISKTKAINTAKSKFPNSSLVHIEWNLIANLIYFDVGLVRDNTIARFIVNAYSGEIVRSAQTQKQGAPLLPANKNNSINNAVASSAQENLNDAKIQKYVQQALQQEKAEKMAKVEFSRKDVERFLASKVPGGIVTELSLNIEFDQPFYEGVLIHDNKYYRFKFDAQTGAILEWNRRVMHDSVRFVRRGPHTVSMPVAPSAPIIQTPSAPVAPGMPDMPSVPSSPVIPAIPDIPNPPAWPSIPNLPKIPVPGR